MSEKQSSIVYDNKSAYSGTKGKAIIWLMTLSHKGVHRFFINLLNVQENDKILDVGCGSGNLVKQLEQKTNLTVCGMDYSPEMVAAAKNNNAKSIQNNKVEIIEASVSNIPYDENTFDKITVFETINFWPGIENDLKEVYRTLKGGGKLFIMNRLPQEGSKWYDWCKLKTPNEYSKALQSAGFESIDTDTNTKPNWIIVQAKKV